MKKAMTLIVTTILGLTLAGCGGSGPAASSAAKSSAVSSAASQVQTAASSAAQAAASSAATSQAAASSSAASATSGIDKAKEGILTISTGDIAIDIKGKKVAMPYRLSELEAAGVPKDDSRKSIKLGAGDFFSANLFLDSKEEYLLIPAYFNGSGSAITLPDAEAKEIKMTTYSKEPKDQGVSLLGASFGMTRSQLKALLGDPKSSEGDMDEWIIKISDNKILTGTYTVYYNKTGDDGLVTDVTLQIGEVQ